MQPSFEETLVDQIYEAAFEPEKWADVLDRLAALSGSDSGVVMTYRGITPIGGRATGLSQDALTVSVNVTPESTQRRMEHCFANPVFGFVDGSRYFPAETRDVVDEKLRDLGLPGMVGTTIPLSDSELAVVVLNRTHSNGPVLQEQIDLLNRYHAHLARSALVAARLGLERARAMTATLSALGVPAAVLSSKGRVRASNALLDEVSDSLKPTAFGGVAITHAPANSLFQKAVEQIGRSHDAAVRSIPVPASEGGDPLVVHLLPLRRSAYDIFSGADLLVAVTRVSATRRAPAPAVLIRLFDLTPSETRLACSLAKGLSLQKAAAACGVRPTTARAYLDSIFRKTGTHRQSELVSLLNSAQAVF